MATTYIVNTILDSLKTALETLTGSQDAGKPLRKVVDRDIGAGDIRTLGILPSVARRRGGPAGERSWEMDVILPMLVHGDGKADRFETVTEIIGDINAVLEAWDAASGNGGTIDMYEWIYWAVPGDKRLMATGARGSLRISFEGPLKRA